MGAETLQAINTFALALAAGIVAMIIARKLQIVPIVLLLLVGVLIGPEALDLLNPEHLGEGLEILLQIGIAIILFEGALTLNYSQYKNIGGVILKLLSLGIIITWLLNALAIMLLFQFPFTYALFLSSIIVVTGPTVIMPILRRINLKKNLTHILHWEGILIDPIGIFLAIFSFEILISDNGSAILFNLFSRVSVGIIIGALLGYVGALVLNKRIVPYDMQNSFILMWALVIFTTCNAILSESGLLGIVIAGIVIGLTKKVSLEDIKKFKFDLTEIFIAVIFILLSSSLSFTNVQRFFPNGLILLLMITLVTRPISIFICAWKSQLYLREKLFLSWLAPRGIVAASIVTIFTFTLNSHSELAPAIADNLWFMEIFVFAVIAFTVVLQGLSAPLVARMLRVSHDPRHTWVIVGAHDFSHAIAEYLMHFGKTVTLLDSNKAKLDHYRQLGSSTEHGDSLSYDIFDRPALVQTGCLLALTDNMELNTLICQHWKKFVRPNNLYKWTGPLAQHTSASSADAATIWSHLSKPSLLSEQLAQHERSLIVKTPKSLSAYEREHAIALLAVNTDGAVLFQPDPNLKELAHLLEKKWLFLIKANFSLATFLQRDNIEVLAAATSTPNLLFAHVLKNLQKAIPAIDPPTYNVLIQNLREQAQKDTVCIGNHVAIFPTLAKNFTAPSLAIVKTAHSFQFNAYDQQPIRLFFFIFAHNADSLRYLSIISHISKLVSQAALREELLAAATSADLQVLIDKGLNKHQL